MKHLALLVTIVTVSEAYGADVVATKINPTNGHSYSVVRGDDPQLGISWADAHEHAKSMGGYLVVINDEDESNWLAESFPADSDKRLDYYYWIGLTDSESEGTFQWVNGEPLVYTNWYGTEPNNAGKGEDYVQIYNFPEGRFSWNDLPNRPVFSEARKDSPVSAIIEVPTQVQVKKVKSEQEGFAGLYYEVNGAGNPIRIVDVGDDRFEIHTPNWTGIGFWDRLRNCYEGVYRYPGHPWGDSDRYDVVGYHRMQPLGEGKFKVLAIGGLDSPPVVPYEIRRTKEDAPASSATDGDLLDELHSLGE